MLRAWYERLRQTRNDFEIVFVSSDKSDVEFRAYAAQMPWLSLDFASRDLKGALGQAFSVTGIPTLVWLDKDGSLITLDGRKKVMQEPDKFPWTEDRPKAAAAGGVVGAYESLASALDPKKTSILNADGDSCSVATLMSEGGGAVRSDADEQLIFNLAFNTTVKLHSFVLWGEKNGPRKVSLFVNRSIGFEDLDLRPTQAFVLPNNHEPVLVNFVQFQKVVSLAMFIESGAESTTVSKLQLFGVKQ